MSSTPAIGGTPRVQIMGVLNLTPDSFSDGGDFLDSSAAIDHAMKMAEDGADILDLGAESTRPGSRGVGAKEQLARILPVLRALRSKANFEALLSIDTQSANVAEACLDEGADMINDVSALRHDSRMGDVLAKWKDARVILTHMLGTPESMQENPQYADVVKDILCFFRERVTACGKSGIHSSRVWLDPGFGFGKAFEHNLEIMRRFHEIAVLSRPLVAGVSRKSFIGRLCGRQVPKERDAASIAAGLVLVQRGASVLRVHDVAGHVSALKVFESLRHS